MSFTVAQPSAQELREPRGWCRASRDCDARHRETRPHACGLGERCRFDGWPAR